MRLIDADALKDKCYITVNSTTIGRNNYVMSHEIDATPTIDAVEVVRCKDCRHRYHTQNESLKQINDSQVETIRTYAQIVKMMDVEINRLRGELI